MSLVEHLEKLRHFQKTASFNSISEAARSINISQAGLSKSISGLEEILQVKLFIRARTGLTLTKEGASLLNASKEIIKIAMLAEQNLRAADSETPVKINIGTYDSIAIYLFPVLKEYLEIVCPEMNLKLVVVNSALMPEMIKSRQLDIAIGVNLETSTSNNTVYRHLFDDSFGLFIHPNQESRIDKLSLITHKFFLAHIASTNKKTSELLLKGRIYHEVYNLETVKLLTAQGMGIGMLPTRVAYPLKERNELSQVSLPKIPSNFGKHSIGLLAAKKFEEKYTTFVDEIYRLAQRWVKN